VRAHTHTHTHTTHNHTHNHTHTRTPHVRKQLQVVYQLLWRSLLEPQTGTAADDVYDIHVYARRVAKVRSPCFPQAKARTGSQS